MRGLGHNQGDIHHLLRAGKRMGHQYTICLCVWHHRGHHQLPDKDAERLFGPSLAKNKKAFVNEFGTELELLEATNQALEIVEGSFV